MTTLAPHTDRARVHAQRVLDAAQALLAAPNDMAARTKLFHAAFNLDWLAVAIVTLAAREPPP